jgi:transmembrane 9 superfamily protein 2/4
MAYGAVFLVGLLGAAHGWYLPGVAPHHFARGERVELKVNKLTSTQTQVSASY